MLKVVEGCEYLDYDYMDGDEARYQGYDTVEDSDFANGFTVTEPERKTEAREAPEKDNNEAESRVPGADDSTDDDDYQQILIPVKTYVWYTLNTGRCCWSDCG